MNLDLHDRRTQLGVGLVLLGLLALLSNFGLFAGLGAIVGMLLFGAAGVLVIGMYRRDPGRVWTLPVGFGLLGLAVATLELPWSGGAFLGAIGLGFLAIWLLDEERQAWWALIPAGVLITLGLVATWDEMVGGRGEVGGTIFFLGLAATFAALYLLPSVQQRWAIWPALGLGVVAVLTLSFSGGWIAPIVLIAAGAWMLTRQSRPEEVRPVAPTSPAPPAPAPGDVPPASPVTPVPAPGSLTEPAPDAAHEPEAPADEAPADAAPAPGDEAAPRDGGPDAADDEDPTRTA
jgi:hypothetical protein